MQLLRNILPLLEEQETGGFFDHSIVIVDNDASESARPSVEAFAKGSRVGIWYFVEPQQNISLARNKAIENAKGELVALIDDDELPGERWLLELYGALKRFGADGVLGPVLPYFEQQPPDWVLKGRFFERPNHETGHKLAWQNTRTGNALLRRDLFKEGGNWFDPAFGSGGEDKDFFRRKIEEGHVFVWCREAGVFEIVPPERWRTAVLVKRALLRGRMALRSSSPKARNVLMSLVAIPIYTACLPLLYILGHHLFMQYLIRDCDHLGKVLTLLGINLVKEKYVRG
jgi:glycosyltransferase involved in cell wall biosynthesis